jgi:hypothetical protein
MRSFFSSSRQAAECRPSPEHRGPVTQPLAAFSGAVAHLVAVAAPIRTAIRVAPNRHVTGRIWGSDTIVTTDQGLPAWAASPSCCPTEH